MIQKLTILLMIQICQHHEKFSDDLMNLQMSSFMQRPMIIRQLHYEGMDSVISGSSVCVKPDATAVHLTSKENFSLANVKILTVIRALTTTMLTGRD